MFNRSEYILTTEYKMFVILNAMMRLACRTASEYAEVIRCHRAMEKSNDHDGYIFDRNFIQLADSGYVRVTFEEVDIFVSHVSRVYEFDVMRLKNAVKNVAEHTSFKDEMYKDARGIAKAVCRVIEVME